jgi:hypothetical protein
LLQNILVYRLAHGKRGRSNGGTEMKPNCRGWGWSRTFNWNGGEPGQKKENDPGVKVPRDRHVHEDCSNLQITAQSCTSAMLMLSET